MIDSNPASLTNPGIFPAARPRDPRDAQGDAQRDATLMARTAQGDREAFADLIDRHKDALVSYLARLAGSPEGAEDLAQEAFLRLYRSAPRYREEGRLAPYLFRIATNLVRSQRRREGVWRKLLAADAGPEPALHPGSAPPPSPQRSALASEEQRQVADAVAALPLRFRVPLVLYEIEGWSYEDIAELLGCRPGTLKSRLHRGRQRLKSALEPYWRRAGSTPENSGTLGDTP